MLTLGLSISASADLGALGFDEMHLQDAMVEFSRYCLVGGLTIAYGGDLRREGFTRALFELVDSHRRAGESVERIRSFLAWPLHLNLAASERAQFRQIARFERIPPPADLGIDPTVFLPPDSAEHRTIWARCLTRMRETMNREIDARVCLGGQVTGYKGKYPGLVEEAWLALQAGKPLYLIGAFGGCARALIEAVEGGRPAALTGAVQLGDPEYAASVALYNQRAAAVGETAVDYEGLLAFLQGRGIAGLNNGLDAVENRRLFETPHIPEMVALVLRGLAGVYGVGAHYA